MPDTVIPPTGIALMQTTLDAYAAFLLQAGRSPNTVKAYCGSISRFAARTPGLPTSAITPQLVRAHVERMAREGQRPRSCRTVVYALRSYCDWLCRCGVIADNPAASVRPAHLDAPLRAVPTDARVAELMRAAEQFPYPDASAMCRAMVALLLTTGMRCAALCALRVPDLDLDGPDPRVLLRCGKGGKTLWVPLAPVAITEVSRWLRVRAVGMAHAGGTPPETHVWCARNVHSGLFWHHPISQFGVWSLLDSVLRAAGVAEPYADLRPHGLRHWFASRLDREGVGLSTIGDLLGHGSVQTTILYLHTDGAQMRDAVEGLRLPGAPDPDPHRKPRRIDRERGPDNGRRFRMTRYR